jgi:hypothetical protein
LGLGVETRNHASLTFSKQTQQKGATK